MTEKVWVPSVPMPLQGWRRVRCMACDTRMKPDVYERHYIESHLPDPESRTSDELEAWAELPFMDAIERGYGPWLMKNAMARLNDATGSFLRAAQRGRISIEEAFTKFAEAAARVVETTGGCLICGGKRPVCPSCGGAAYRRKHPDERLAGS